MPSTKEHQEALQSGVFYMLFVVSFSLSNTSTTASFSAPAVGRSAAVSFLLSQGGSGTPWKPKLQQVSCRDGAGPQDFWVLGQCCPWISDNISPGLNYWHICHIPCKITTLKKQAINSQDTNICFKEHAAGWEQDNLCLSTKSWLSEPSTFTCIYGII